MFKRCKHEWKILSEHKEKSGLDKLLEAGFSKAKFIPNEWMKGTHITILTCTQCGKIHTEVTEV